MIGADRRDSHARSLCGGKQSILDRCSKTTLLKSDLSKYQVVQRHKFVHKQQGEQTVMLMLIAT